MALRSKPTSPEAFIEAANFSDSGIQQRLQSLEKELDQKIQREQQLITEIEQLRERDITEASSGLDEAERIQLQSQIDELRDYLKETQGAVDYPIHKIFPNPDQPRKTFEEEVEAMMLSLKQEGQLEPAILFEDGMLFDGECRWRAMQRLGRETIKVVFTSQPQDKKTIRRRAYLSSLHRRGLNPLDRAETLVAIACDNIPALSAQGVPRIVSRVLKRLKRQQIKLDNQLHLQPVEQQRTTIEQLKSQSIELDEIEVEVFLIFLGLQEHPASLERNIFPTLKLSADLKEAVRQKQLGCPQALALNGLSAKDLDITEKQALKLRQKGVEAVTTQTLSESETKRWVVEQKKRFIQDASVPTRDRQVDRIITTVRALDLTQVAPSPSQRQELEQLLEGILQDLRNCN